MQIDIVLATFNRAGLLRKAIDSFAHTRVPDGCTARLVVVDNNSKDDTRRVAEAALEAHPDRRISYVFEPRQGKAHALNSGIARSKADVIGFYDDDEQLAPDWLDVLHQAFLDPVLEFAGGPVLPDWSRPPPAWLPRQGYGGVLSLVSNGEVRRQYGQDGFAGMLIGANAAVRRTTLCRCGPYTTRFKWAEDRQMYARLLAEGAVGYYLPKLVVYHHILDKRLTKRYFRQWAHAEGRTNGSELQALEAGPLRTVAGAPLWMWRRAVSSAGVMTYGYARCRTGDPGVFGAELDLRQFLSFYIERNFPFIRQRHFDRT
ncbi:glycosyltransferase [Rhodopila sp.]|uniref:glycosyltransferase n=1 Tax=Rhodopila sp. TaxID=2480087 RepID=UPI003D0A664F